MRPPGPGHWATAGTGSPRAGGFEESTYPSQSRALAMLPPAPWGRVTHFLQGSWAHWSPFWAVFRNTLSCQTRPTHPFRWDGHLSQRLRAEHSRASWSPELGDNVLRAPARTAGLNLLLKGQAAPTQSPSWKRTRLVASVCHLPATAHAAVHPGPHTHKTRPRGAALPCHLDVLVWRGLALALLRFSGFPLKFDFTKTSFGFLQCCKVDETQGKDFRK